jgi:hypothetical protein
MTTAMRLDIRHTLATAVWEFATGPDVISPCC